MEQSVLMELDSINIAALSQRRRYALYEGVSLENRATYHHLSQRPLTNQGARYYEDRLELLLYDITHTITYVHHVYILLVLIFCCPSLPLTLTV
jgi:hypothetical protein